MEIRGIPFDAPLYMTDAEGTFTFRDCEGIMATYLIAGETSDLLPAGLRPASVPAAGGVMISRYAFSTVGEYCEQTSFMQVVDEEGRPGFYVPYMYVTNDAAMAVGRELLGAPKKLARIGVTKEYDLVQGTLERPSGKRLLTVTMKPATRMPLDIFRTLIPSRMPVYSVRHLPPVGGRGGVTQLVRWWADVTPHTDSRGEVMLYAGPASVTFDSPSVTDPVHRLAVGQMVSAIYLQFDMRMGVTAVVKEY